MTMLKYFSNIFASAFLVLVLSLYSMPASATSSSNPVTSANAVAITGCAANYSFYVGYTNGSIGQSQTYALTMTNASTGVSGNFVTPCAGTWKIVLMDMALYCNSEQWQVMILNAAANGSNVTPSASNQGGNWSYLNGGDGANCGNQGGYYSFNGINGNAGDSWKNATTTYPNHNNIVGGTYNLYWTTPSLKAGSTISMSISGNDTSGSMNEYFQLCSLSKGCPSPGSVLIYRTGN